MGPFHAPFQHICQIVPPPAPLKWPPQQVAPCTSGYLGSTGQSCDGPGSQPKEAPQKKKELETGTLLAQEEVSRPTESPESYTPSQPFHPSSTFLGLWVLQSRKAPGTTALQAVVLQREPFLGGAGLQDMPRGDGPSPALSRAPRPLRP